MIFIDTEKCTGCGECVASCPNDCIKMGDELNYDEVAYILYLDCTDCGVCVSVCPNGAIMNGGEEEGT